MLVRRIPVRSLTLAFFIRTKIFHFPKIIQVDNQFRLDSFVNTHTPETRVTRSKSDFALVLALIIQVTTLNTVSLDLEVQNLQPMISLLMMTSNISIVKGENMWIDTSFPLWQSMLMKDILFWKEPAVGLELGNFNPLFEANCFTN
jgi:hypothetical protein